MNTNEIQKTNLHKQSHTSKRGRLVRAPLPPLPTLLPAGGRPVVLLLFLMGPPLLLLVPGEEVRSRNRSSLLRKRTFLLFAFILAPAEAESEAAPALIAAVAEASAPNREEQNVSRKLQKVGCRRTSSKQSDLRQSKCHQMKYEYTRQQA